MFLHQKKLSLVGGGQNDLFVLGLMPNFYIKRVLSMGGGHDEIFEVKKKGVLSEGGGPNDLFVLRLMPIIFFTCAAVSPWPHWQGLNGAMDGHILRQQRR